MRAEAAIEDILALFLRRGGEHYGEGVSQLEHALQCAALAERAGAPDSLVAAALLHDYGHLVEDRGRMAEAEGVDAEHEAVGALALSAWFGPEVTRPIALHVSAKRHLCAVAPGYRDALSPASQLSLHLQGGPFEAPEAAAFARRPFAHEAVRLRRWDDAAKVIGAQVGDLGRHRPLLLRLAR